MGHERVGVLPKTKSWRNIVAQIALGTGADFQVALITERTLSTVREQFVAVEDDGAMEAAFTFLVDLARSARDPNDPEILFALLPEHTTAATPLKVARALREITAEAATTPELRVLADGAAADAIAIWFDLHKGQPSLFSNEQHIHFDVWHQAADGAGFCELSRLYFSKYVERYLNYFLEREASAILPNLSERDRFQREMKANVEQVSLHAFETAKITQSFAAGWFNKNAIEGQPSRQAIHGFLSHIFGKLRAELLREGQDK